ncbi:AMP-binding protein [Piscinibacter aquaticus]|uniref:AMP-binding protein n=1 Tax=Piscinibacter aquaticus TaxID=392597 RepID=A0A5C6U359_9BURK|nr:AMP-binding protein [Piscinibacter aquaticus]
MLFTSGSTGTPKGVAMGALPLRHLIAWHAAHPRLGQPACTLQFAPLSFDVHFQEILSTVACGGTLVLLPDARRRDPAQLHAAIVEHGVQRLFLPYVALQMLAEASREDPPRCLREVVSAGEQLQVTPAIRALFRALPDAQLHNHYGPTESHVVTAHELTGDAADWPEIPPIGKALPHVRLALADAEQEGGVETGELLIGGETLAHGYIGREDLTGERFRADPAEPGHRWYVTGDLVRRDAEGIVTYLGRADGRVKVDGFRIEPGEIELALMRHPSVRDAVVTAPVIPGAGRQLVAHVVLRQPVADLPAALRSHLRGQVPDYMVPVRYVVLERLPTTPSGKINRRGLPLPEPEPAPTATADPAEMARELWCQLLGVSGIAPDQNLFDLGARSLMVLRFVARLRELGIDGLSVTDIYDRPTLRGIAERLRGGSAGVRSARGRAAASGTRSGAAPSPSSAWRRAPVMPPTSGSCGSSCWPARSRCAGSPPTRSTRPCRPRCASGRTSSPRAACWRTPLASTPASSASRHARRF